MSATRQSVKLAAVLGATALAVLPFPSGTANGAESISNLAFTSEAYGAPVAVLLYEPASNIPVDPDEPHLQATFSYTQTSLETGPKSRALASSIWPGAAVGDGFSTLCECDENYRIRAVAQEPGGEKESAQELPPPEATSQGFPNFDAGMHARAKGYDVFAEADGGGNPFPQAPIALGTGSSQSTSTTEKGFAVARTVVRAKDIKLLEGIISIGSVATNLEAKSNTDGATASGVTAVNGLTIAGNGYTVDGKGLHPVQEDKPAPSPLPSPVEAIPGQAELKKELGISVYLDEHESEAQNTTASRSASGLRISIETARLRERLDEGPIYPFLEQLPSQLDELQAPLYQFLAAAPRIDFVLGRGFVESSSVIPYEFPDIPTPTGGIVTTPPTTTPPPTTTTPPTTSVSGGPGLSSVGGGAPTSSVAGPQVVSSAARPVAAGQPLAAGPVETPLAPAGAQGPALFAGLPPGLVIGALAAAALAAKGLGNFAGIAMGGGGGPMCSTGARKNVPNLRDL